MIYINGNWESVKNIHDVTRIIRDLGYDEFAEAAMEIYNNNHDLLEKIERLECEVYELNDELDEYSDYDQISDAMKAFEEDLDKLENYILEQPENEFKEGLKAAYRMLRGKNSI